MNLTAAISVLAAYYRSPYTCTPFSYYLVFDVQETMIMAISRGARALQALGITPPGVEPSRWDLITKRYFFITLRNSCFSVCVGLRTLSTSDLCNILIVYFIFTFTSKLQFCDFRRWRNIQWNFYSYLSHLEKVNLALALWFDSVAHLAKSWVLLKRFKGFTTNIFFPFFWSSLDLSRCMRVQSSM